MAAELERMHSATAYETVKSSELVEVLPSGTLGLGPAYIICKKACHALFAQY